jgi:hypothetical protein
MVEKIVLVEGKEDVEDLRKIIKDSKTKIISFDFESHIALNKYGLKHIFVEEYLSKKDEELIDNKTVELTVGWYKHPEIEKLLKINEINLGSLLQIELIWYFFQCLKRSLGIKRVVEKENPKKIFSSFLNKYVSELCENSDVKLYKQKSTKNSSLFFDSIEISIQIRGKIIPLKISRKKFMKIKKIVTTTINLFYNFKPKIKELEKKKTILLLDFNPVQYEELLKSLSNSKNNILLLNQRRPAVWNYNSLQILRKTKCKIIELDDLQDKSLLKIIKNEKYELEKQLEKLWIKDKIFQEIFSIEDFSFWNVIKENFSHLTTTRFIETIERFFLLSKFFDKININIILEWAHVGLEDKLIISMANKRKIPNMFLQHGLYIQNKKFDKYLPILPILPSEGSKHVVWGKILKEHILNYNIKSDEVIEIGSPRHDKIFTENNQNKKTNTILLAANGMFHNNCSGSDTRAFIKIENYTKKIIEIIKKNPEKKLIVKLHPGKVSYDIKPLIKEIDPSIQIFQNENIFEIFKKCDAVISLNYSTIVLDAMIAQIPSLVILPEEQNFEDEPALKNGNVLYVNNINNLESAMDELLFNNLSRDNLIKKGNAFTKDYITNRGNASKRLMEILEKYE